MAALRETVTLNDSVAVFCTATDRDDDPLTYIWQADGGQISSNDSQVRWKAPAGAGAGRYWIQVQVEDGKGGMRITQSVYVQVNREDRYQTG